MAAVALAGGVDDADMEIPEGEPCESLEELRKWKSDMRGHGTVAPGVVGTLLANLTQYAVAPSIAKQWSDCPFPDDHPAAAAVAAGTNLLEAAELCKAIVDAAMEWATDDMLMMVMRWVRRELMELLDKVVAPDLERVSHGGNESAAAATLERLALHWVRFRHTVKLLALWVLPSVDKSANTSNLKRRMRRLPAEMISCFDSLSVKFAHLVVVPCTTLLNRSRRDEATSDELDSVAKVADMMLCVSQVTLSAMKPFSHFVGVSQHQLAIRPGMSYFDRFHVPVVESAQEWYRGAALEAAEAPVREYLADVERILKREAETTSERLHRSTRNANIYVVQQEMLLGPGRAVLARVLEHFPQMLRDAHDAGAGSEHVARAFALYNDIRPSRIKVNGAWFPAYDSDATPVVSQLATGDNSFFEFVRDAGLDIVKARFTRVKEHIDSTTGGSKGEGGERSRLKNYDPEFIEALVSLYRWSEARVKGDFRGAAAFKAAHGEAFKEILGKAHEVQGQDAQAAYGHAHCVCAYFDFRLRRGDMTDEKLRRTIEDLLHIATFLDGDIFIAHYRRFLGDRLVQAKGDLDAEKIVVQELSMKYGKTATFNLEGMLKDVVTSADISTSYSEFARVNANRRGAARVRLPPWNFDCRVYTTTRWPRFQDIPEVRVPPDAQACMDHFVKFYVAGANKDRRLVWQWSQGRATVVARMYGSTKTLEMTTLQLFALLRFEDRDEWELGELAEQLGVTEDVMKRVVHPLALRAGTAKKSKNVIVLVKAAGGAGGASRTKFVLNKDVAKCPNRLIKYHPPQWPRPPVEKQVDTDRKHHIDAMVVRIMKARKTMPHKDLMNQVIDNCAATSVFTPTSKAVKLRIEDLIEREYLARESKAGPDGKPTMVYQYLA